MRTLLALRSLAALASLALATACGSSAGTATDPTLVQSKLSRDTSPAVSASDSATLVAGNTNFAFDMYQDLAKSGDTTNLFYSPYSISLALAMTYAGAAGSTATEMATALDFELPPMALHPAFDALDLQLASRAMGQAGADGKAFQLNIADSLWLDGTLKLQEPFLDTLAVDYGAGAHVVDFIDSPDAARTKINGWVSDETADRIENLLPAGSIDATTRFVLVNAIYFDAGWATAFDPSATEPGAFHRLDGSTTMPDMMSNSLDSAGYFQGNGYVAAELAYAGGQTSLVIVLPDDGAFATVESELTADFASTLFSSLSYAPLQVTIPKFTVTGATISLKAALSDLGMPDAFTGAANFSGMTGDESLHIDDVYHQAFCKVDESGTEAAAATAVVGVHDSIVLTPQTITVDRPFFYLIRDIPTNTVLFLGREVDPS